MSAHILIVEDDDSIRMLLNVICRKIAATCTSVPNGSEAIRLLDEGIEFSGIVLDLMMPDVDGIAVLEHIRQRGHGIPIIVTTAAIHRAKQIPREPPVVDVITKPFDIEKLQAALKALG